MHFYNIYIFVLLALSSVVRGASHFGSTGGWKTVDFPNPMTDPLRCGRKEVPRSRVCDPDHLLSKDSQDEVEGHINFIKTGQVAVAVVKKMDLSEFGSDIDVAAKSFCRTLHDTWGVGSVEKNDGVVVFASVEDRVVYISTGDGSKNLLTPSAIDAIIYRMKPFLRKADYGGALINCVIEIEMLFSGKTLPLHPPRHSSTKDDSEPIKFGLFLCIILGFGGYAYYNSRKMQRMERGRIALDNLIREVDNTSRGSEGDKVFVTTSCPICLENFPAADTDAENGSTVTENASMENDAGKDSETSDLLRSLEPHPASPVFEAKTNTTPSAAAKNRPMALRCGHTFCHDCISTYLKTNEGKKCPICRFPVHADYDGMDPLQPTMRPPSQGGAGSGGNQGGYDDGTSCRPSNSTQGQSQGTDGRNLESVNTEDAARAHQDPMQGEDTRTQYNTYTRGGFGTRGPEFHYRLNRMRYLYPDIMTVQMLHNMNRAVDRGELHEMRTELATRSVEVQRAVTEMRAAAERAARQSGRGGSSGGSFGGGSSSGGGGGRW
uniref:RING-type domain-containing protein n=1 Tax=Spumella elongata TaxID=89044 RepID=A0A7S3MD19_9STRA|mmetsp:Transcript_56164/g.98531  ORF Transcript_56164/g.98531 Transcript_56164/m.98531 type:complete len:548 (+) Transcript_56164:83-1726(+)